MNYVVGINSIPNKNRPYYRYLVFVNNKVNSIGELKTVLYYNTVLAVRSITLNVTLSVDPIPIGKLSRKTWGKNTSKYIPLFIKHDLRTSATKLGCSDGWRVLRINIANSFVGPVLWILLYIPLLFYLFIKMLAYRLRLALVPSSRYPGTLSGN